MYILRSLSVTKYDKRDGDIVSLAWENNLPEKKFKSKLFALIGYHIRVHKTKKTCKYYSVILLKEHHSRVYVRHTQNYELWSLKKEPRSHIKTLKRLDKVENQIKVLEEELKSKKKEFKNLQNNVKKYWDKKWLHGDLDEDDSKSHNRRK